MKIAIVGRPNTGKSHIFSNLTRKYSMSGNYPFTTLEMKRAHCRLGGHDCEIIDTPGLHCLFIHSEEEKAVRDLIFTEKPDVIVQCVDANRLKQSLTLTVDLLELGSPMVISLNAIDETARKGVWIDSEALSLILGIPVVEMVAINGRGIGALKDAILKATRGEKNVRYGQVIEDGICRISQILPADMTFKRKLAVLLIQHDPFLGEYLGKTCDSETAGRLKEEAAAIRKSYRGSVSLQINDKRDKWINNIHAEVVRKHKIALGGFSQTASMLSRHPYYGLPIMLGILLTFFFAVVTIANGLAALMNRMFWLPLESGINRYVSSVFWNDFLVGDYGVLTLGVSNAILTVLPILGVFFILFNMLEDSGYIPNLCVLLKRVSSKIGVTGNAILPITLAFGCKTMATLTTKSLRSGKEKFIAIYLIAFGIPCAAQMALNMSILGGLGLGALFITFGVLATVWTLVGMSLNIILHDDRQLDFIQELPAMRLPQARTVLKKTYYKLTHFLEEALPIFVSAAIALFTADRIGLLDAIKNFLKPMITGFLGFPLQMVDVLVLLMAKHEAAAGMLIKLVRRGQLDYIQSIVAVTLTMMFVPCLTNIIAMIKEQGTKKALLMVLIINCTAILIAGALKWVLVGTVGT